MPLPAATTYPTPVMTPTPTPIVGGAAKKEQPASPTPTITATPLLGVPTTNRVAIVSPAQGSLVNGQVHIVGLISEHEQSAVKSYQLAYRPLGTSTAQTISQGQPDHEVEVIGVWDSSQVPDG